MTRVRKADRWRNFWLAVAEFLEHYYHHRHRHHHHRLTHVTGRFTTG